MMRSGAEQIEMPSEWSPGPASGVDWWSRRKCELGHRRPVCTGLQHQGAQEVAAQEHAAESQEVSAARDPGTAAQGLTNTAFKDCPGNTGQMRMTLHLLVLSKPQCQRLEINVLGRAVSVLELGRNFFLLPIPAGSSHC